MILVQTMDNGGILYSNFKAPVPPNVIRGSGKLTWLSSKAGLIAANQPNQCVVSFQLKDFCDPVSFLLKN